MQKTVLVQIQLHLQTLVKTPTCVNPQWNRPIETENAAIL